MSEFGKQIHHSFPKINECLFCAKNGLVLGIQNKGDTHPTGTNTW